jgi:pimeloyl-ACP methyl ester carboxylesterase
MHGWEGRAGQLGAFVDPLVASGHRVVAIDGPAHGRSPGRRTDITQFAGALRATERKLGPIDGVIAHSLGATSVTVALRHGLGPRRLVYVAPMAFAEVPFRKFLSLVGIDARVETNLRARIERAYGTDVWTRYELANLVGNPQAALLVIHDEKDRDVSVEEGKALAAAWPRGEIVVTSGLGHRRILRDAEVVKRAVAFLQSR